MKFFYPVLVFVLVALSAEAQKKSLYGTPTLYNSIENPADPFFLGEREFLGLNLPIPSLRIDASIRGHGRNVILDAVFGDQLIDLSVLRVGGNRVNRINTQVELNSFMMKLRLNKKTKGEISISSTTKFQANIEIRDEFIDVFLGGNFPYIGSQIDGFFDLQTEVFSYHEVKAGYRMEVNDKLSIGASLGFLKGIQYQQVDVSDSYIYFAPRDSGYFIESYAKGTARSAGVDTEELGDIGQQLFNSATDFKDLLGSNSFNLGVNYQLNDALLLSFNLTDVGAVNWRQDGRIYRLDKKIKYEGVDITQEAEVRDSIFQSFGAFAIDSFDKVFKTPLNQRFKAGGAYTFNSRFVSRLFLIQNLYRKGTEIHSTNDFRFARNLHLIVNAGASTRTFYQLGATLLLRSPVLDIYLGSEQIANTLITDFSPGTNIHFGFAWRISTQNPEIKRRKKAAMCPTYQ
jgi:hypothetical protein